jgi:enamine deaminase RidA (YjgF/YER057c/UK114 family)
MFLAGSVADDLELDIAGQTRHHRPTSTRCRRAPARRRARIVSATVWLADIADAPAYNAIWKEWVDPANLPARATVEAKLFSPKCRIEIMCVAAKASAAAS